MTSRRLLLLLGISFVVLLLPIGILTYINWCKVKDGFFTYTLTDVVNVVVTIVVGIGITFYLTFRTNNYAKKTEILFGNIDSIIEVYIDIVKSFEKSNGLILGSSEKQRLVKLFRDISKEITNMEEYVEECVRSHIGIKANINCIKYLSFDLKTCITDKPFSALYKVTINDINSASDKYYEIKRYFQKTKMMLFA